MLVYHFSLLYSYIHCTDSCIALWRAEFHVWPCGSKCFAAVFTYLQTGIVIGQHQLLIILDRIVDGWLGIGCRGYITFQVFLCQVFQGLSVNLLHVWTENHVLLRWYNKVNHPPGDRGRTGTAEKGDVDGAGREVECRK